MQSCWRHAWQTCILEQNSLISSSKHNVNQKSSWVWCCLSSWCSCQRETTNFFNISCHFLFPLNFHLIIILLQTSGFISLQHRLHGCCHEFSLDERALCMKCSCQRQVSSTVGFETSRLLTLALKMIIFGGILSSPSLLLLCWIHHHLQERTYFLLLSSKSSSQSWRLENFAFFTSALIL